MRQPKTIGRLGKAALGDGEPESLTGSDGRLLNREAAD